MSKEVSDEDLVKMMKALTCPQDCEKCGKTEKECRLDIRICLNVLLKERQKRFREKKEKKRDLNGMIS